MSTSWEVLVVLHLREREWFDIMLHDEGTGGETLCRQWKNTCKVTQILLCQENNKLSLALTYFQAVYCDMYCTAASVLPTLVSVSLVVE